MADADGSNVRPVWTCNAPAIQGVADPVAALRVELLFLRSVIIGSTLAARLAGIRAIEPPTQ